jgi:hypothetical protein
MTEPAAAAQASVPSLQADRGVTLRVVLFSLSLALVLGYLIPVIDYKIFNTFLGATHLPPGAIGALLVLVLVVNPLLGLVSQRLKFTRNEALTVYITCLFSCLVSGHGSENFLVPNLVASFYFANANNKWMDFLPQVKHWLTPALNPNGTVNSAVVAGWYETGTIPWAAWLVPLLFWGTLVFTSYIMLGCLSAMLRAQWGEKEALAFPLLRLPLELTEDMEPKPDRAQFFRNPMMWTGFGLAVFIQAMRGLNVYFPDFPTVPLELNTAPMLKDPPWNQLGGVPVQIFPLAVGVTYLLTTEVSFSLWFFYWFIKLQNIGLYYLGYPGGTLPGAASTVPGKAITGFQMVGCYLVFVGLVLWTGREHFRHVALRAFGRVKPEPGERQEVMSYPVAFWGFVLGFSGVIGLTCATGVRLDVALALWVGYLIFAIGLSRVAVEGGMLSLITDSAPLGIAARLSGVNPSGWLSFQAGIVPASFVQAVFAVHMRGFIMPSYLHAFKLAHDRGIAPRKLLALLAAVILISFGMGLATCVRLGYENGGLTLGHKWYATSGSLWPANFVNNMNKTGDNYPFWNWAAVIFGAALTWGMMLMRSRFAWFPLHPIGYLMCQTFPGYTFWFSIFLGWLAKAIITRYGGTDSYRKTTPFFLGLAFGDVAMILFWLAIDGWQGRAGHQLLPG